MVGGVHYYTVHLNMFSLALSDGIKFVFAGSVGKPLKFGQFVIVGAINKCEFPAGKRYPADGFGAGFAVFVETSTRCKEIPAGVEIPAGLFEADYPPPADKVGLLFAAEHRPVGTHHPDRKKAVITTGRDCRLYHFISYY